MAKGVVGIEPNKAMSPVIIDYGQRKEFVYPMFEWEINRIRSLRNSLHSHFFSMAFSAACTLGIAIGTGSLSNVWSAVLIALVVLTAFFAVGTYLDRREYKQLIQRLEKNRAEIPVTVPTNTSSPNGK